MALSVPEILARLRRLGEERKFSAEPFYPGAPTEEIRAGCERLVNDFLGDIIDLVKSGTDREQLFARARTLIRDFGREDTEEREKVGDYIGETMRIINIEDWTDHV